MRWSLRPVVATGRSCGTCALCCRLLTIPETPDRPAGTWCPHARPTAPAGACQIYDTRPESCRTFQCVWLAGHLPEAWRPDKLKAVLGADMHEPMLLHLYEDPHGPEVSRGRLADWLARQIRNGFLLCIHRGAAARVRGERAAVEALLARLRARGEPIEVVGEVGEG